MEFTRKDNGQTDIQTNISCIIAQIKRDIGRKSRFFSYPVHLTTPLWGSRRSTAIPFRTEKPGWLPGGEKTSDDMQCMTVSTEYVLRTGV